MGVDIAVSDCLSGFEVSYTGYNCISSMYWHCRVMKTGSYHIPSLLGL